MFFFFQAEDGIRDFCLSRGLGDVYKRQPLDIVYEDDDLLVVDKPRGMVVHPAAGNESGTLVNALMFHCKDRLSSINGVIRPGIVHRIDKDTSGLLVVAKNDIAHELLSQQLADHSITRKYEALVFDNLKQDEGTVEAPIGRDPKNLSLIHISEPTRQAEISYAVFCLKKKKIKN